MVQYADADKLYVPIDQVGLLEVCRLRRRPPKIYKLGGGGGLG